MPVGKLPTYTTKGDNTWPTDLALLLGIPAPKPNNKNFERGKSDETVSYTLDGTNYAAGGATLKGPGFILDTSRPQDAPPSVPSYDDSLGHHPGQIESYLQNNKINPHALYVIQGGANDFFTAK